MYKRFLYAHDDDDDDHVKPIAKSNQLKIIN